MIELVSVFVVVLYKVCFFNAETTILLIIIQYNNFAYT